MDMLLTFKAYTSLQPFNYNYTYQTNSTQIYNSDLTALNSYKGGVFQQAVSALTQTNQQAYELSGGGFSVYGYEYKPGTSDAVCSLSHVISAQLSLGSMSLGYQTTRLVGRY
jgi:beta-glucanase (GH16 family)